MKIITISSKKLTCVLLLLSSLYSFLIVSIAVDTISTTQSLTDGNTLVSTRGTFELGFFSPRNSKYRYLGIWYKQVTTQTIVWVANGNNPFSDTSGSLNLTNQGILILTNSTNTEIWSSNSSKSARNPTATLLETGNFVVKDENGDNDYLWQSFDYPSDTLLPDMKLGRDLNTGLDRFLWSWRDDNDPSKGSFIFRLDPNGFPQLVLTNGSVEQFRSGPWNGRSFSGSPGLKPNPVYTYDFVFNEREIYYGFSLINSSVYSRLQLSSSGVLQRFTWNYRTQVWVPYLNAPADNCDTYGLCHSYGSCDIGDSPVCGCLDKFVPKDPNNWYRTDWSNGCVRRIDLDCQNGDGFVKYSGFKLPDTRNSWFSRTMNLDECGKMCLGNCSCMAYANLDIRDGGSGCLLWFDELIDMRVLSENVDDIYIRMSASESDSSASGPGSQHKKGKIQKIVAPLVVGMFLLSLSIGLYVWKKKKDKRKELHQQELLMKKEGSSRPDSKRHTGETHKDDAIPFLDFATIANATDNFSFNNKLGEGGFGPVYKGVLKEGQLIAVKRLSRHSAQGVDEFKNEVVCIAKLQHRNLVRLLACCIEGEEKMLVYEYMPNNSLDSFIFDKTRKAILDWPKRFNIINGVARGLLYLHQDSRLRVIHRDLKAANVLLDVDMNPKISDFGMARSFGGNETEANTQRIVGTYGYMSPEYAVDGIISVKSDVFSFGVLVLELVSGKKNRGFFHADHSHNLLGHAWILYNEGRTMELIDANLRESCDEFEVLRSVHVALLCVQQHPEDRPKMSNAVLMLGSEGELGRPKEPGFFTERNVFLESQYSSSTYKEVSANEMSITLLDAR